jgi:sulfur relay protein TusB/DsrH
MSQESQQLHLIQCHYSLAEFKKHLSRFSISGDSIIFLNDSVYALLTEAFNSDDFYSGTNNHSLFVLREHCEARAMKSLPLNIKAIEYDELVKQTINATKVISW